MYSLIIDTATNLMYLCLYKDENCFFEYKGLYNKNHSSYLVHNINNLLTTNNLSIKNIKEIIVGSGPGSYTGIRVAGVVAKTLCYTLNIPLYKISSLALLSSSFDSCIASIDARNNAYFAYIKNLLPDGYYTKDYLLNTYPNYPVIELNFETSKIDIVKIINTKERIINIHSYEPNYVNKVKVG